jgi:hypothetical protein
MRSGPRQDAYAGPDCITDESDVLRPFNYLLLSETAQQLRIEVRGFCRGDPQVRVLDTIYIEI